MFCSLVLFDTSTSIYIYLKKKKTPLCFLFLGSYFFSDICSHSEVNKLSICVAEFIRSVVYKALNLEAVLLSVLFQSDRT